MQVLSKVFETLKKAMLKAQQEHKVKYFIYIVDNSEVENLKSTVELCLDNFFANVVDIDYKFIQSDKNAGYGYGNNIAINQINTKYHLVMNPDVYVEEESLLNAINYLEGNPEIGLLTPAIFGEDGEQHFLCKKNPTLFDLFLRSFAPLFIRKIFNKRILSFEMREKNYNTEIKNIPFPSGCFMLFKTTVLKKINGFDDAFFMYFEDADIGRRLLKISQSMFVPSVKIIHKWSRQTHASMKFKLITVKSGLIYWKKHGGFF